jgi:hypothetical protein
MSIMTYYQTRLRRLMSQHIIPPTVSKRDKSKKADEWEEYLILGNGQKVSSKWLIGLANSKVGLSLVFQSRRKSRSCFACPFTQTQEQFQNLSEQFMHQMLNPPPNCMCSPPPPVNPVADQPEPEPEPEEVGDDGETSWAPMA